MPLQFDVAPGASRDPVLELRLRSLFYSAEAQQTDTGSYLKLANGVLLCWQRWQVSSTDPQGWDTTNAVYDLPVTIGGAANTIRMYYRTYIWTFPHPFAAQPTLSVTGDVSVLDMERVLAYNSPTAPLEKAVIEVGGYTNTVNAQFHALAVGWWK